MSACLQASYKSRDSTITERKKERRETVTRTCSGVHDQDSFLSVTDRARFAAELPKSRERNTSAR